MTVQELIKILQKQDPTDLVVIETYPRGSTAGDTFVVEDEWKHVNVVWDEELHSAFLLVAYGDRDRLCGAPLPPCRYETFSGECLHCGAQIDEDCTWKREQKGRSR